MVGSGELPNPEDKKVEDYHKEQQADLLPQEVKWLGLSSFQLPSPKGNFKDDAVTEKTLAMSRSAFYAVLQTLTMDYSMCLLPHRHYLISLKEG